MKKIIINQTENIKSDIIHVELKRLEQLCSDDIKDKKIAVTLSENIEYIPNLKEYLENILSDIEHKDIINKLRFISMETKGPIGCLPIFKYLNSLNIIDRKELNIKEQTKLSAVYNKQIDIIKKQKTNKKDYSTIREIRKAISNDFVFSKLCTIIISNFDNLKSDDIKKFLKDELAKDNFEFITELRKIFLLYDYRINKETL